MISEKENKELTRLSHNAIALSYYNEYHSDKSDLVYFDEFINMGINKALDLGCGMGHYSAYMHSKGLDVVGVDFSSGMLDIARKNSPGINFIEADISNLPDTLDNDFNAVVLAFVIHHISKEETNKCLKDLKKYLKKEAYLMIIYRSGKNTLVEEEPFNRNFKYLIKEYSDDELIALLKENGFNTIKIIEKPYSDDENSLSKSTKILYAKSF